LDKQLLFKLVRAMPMEMVSDAVINNRRVPIDWQWREYETLRLYSTFLCYKNVCFEIMNWKYEFIEITLILTINDDILVTLNDITLTSTILVNLYSLWHAHSGKRHSHNMQGFTVLSDFMSQNRPCSLFWQHIYGMVPLSVTQNQAIIVQYELACVPDCFHV
jgi:hypothetical protein